MSENLYPNFIHLHVRTGHSFYQSTIKVSPFLEKVKDLNFRAIAVADNDDIHGAMSSYFKARSEGVKIIVGATVTVRKLSTFSNQSKLILLCENKIGYQNLCRLLSEKSISKLTLEKYSAGLIALSGGFIGEINNLCFQNREEDATKVAQWLSSTFSGRFFIELHPAMSTCQRELNSRLRRIAAQISVETVATAPCHYLLKEDLPVLDILRKIGKLPTLKEVSQNTGWDSFWLMSPEEITAAFIDDPASVEQSSKIADLCQFEFEKSIEFPPCVSSPAGQNYDEQLRVQAFAGLNAINLDPADYQQYCDRLDKELSAIRAVGLSQWFLFVDEIVTIARQSHISIGPARGTCPASLTIHCLGVSELDPIKHGLIFERFLNEERFYFPDFFIEVPSNRQAELLDRIAACYGRDRVALLTFYHCLEGRSLVRHLGKSLDIDAEKVNHLINRCPEYSGAKFLFIDALCKEDRIQSIISENRELEQLLVTAQKLSDLPYRASSLNHELLVTQRPTSEYFPVSKKAHIARVQSTFGTTTHLGLKTMTIDGLKGLEKISSLCQLNRIDISNIPLNDPTTWRLISAGNTKGIFELGSLGMQKLLRKIQPEEIAHITAAIALNRPGPLQDGLVANYIKGRHGKAELKGIPAPIADILKETYGVIVYQEQIMEIAHRLAGYSYSEADTLRRLLARQFQESNEEQLNEFLSRADKIGTTREIAEEVFNMINSAVQSTFLKSHAASYALISYRMAYLKAHYPNVF